MAGGGKGANQAVAAARAGGLVTFVARIGDDVFGERALAGFAADGIDTRFVLRTSGAASGIALIDVDDRGENSISVASGANALLSAADVESAADAFAAADIVLVQLESPIETVEAAVRKAGERGIPVILNPAPARPLDEGLLSRVSVLTPNENEAELLSGIAVRDEGGVRSAAARLRARGPATVVITMGERGAYASSTEFEGAGPGLQGRSRRYDGGGRRLQRRPGRGLGGEADPERRPSLRPGRRGHLRHPSRRPALRARRAEMAFLASDSEAGP